MRNVWLAAFSGLFLGGVFSAVADPADSNYRLVFADEFNGTNVDTSKWVVASPSWTMPNSDSTASASQVSVGSGVLTLKATRPGTAGSFTAGSISSYGVYNFVGGYVEARIKMPTTPGSWPAFWGLYNNWPPEADIMEYPMKTGSGNSTLSSASYNTNFHYTDTNGNNTAGAGPVTSGASLAGTWHIFAMDWTAGTGVKFYLDGNQVSSYTGSAVAQMVSMYMLLDYAVGGSWAGTPSTTTWPVGWSDQTLVDWVHVWQKNPNGDTASTWKLNGGGAFTTSGNWTNAIVPKFGNQTAVFGRVGSAATASITMPTWTVFGGVTFNGAADGSTTAYTLGSSANTIQLAGQSLGSTTNDATVQASATSAGNQAINAKVELWDNVTLDNDMTGGQTLSLNGEVSGAGALTVTGVGATVLSATNTYTGATSIGIGQGVGVLRANANNALGSGGVVIGPSGNTTTARLELTGQYTQTAGIDFRGRNSVSVGIENVSGNNVLAGTISAGAGGGAYPIQSDAGSLTLGGILQAASGARIFTLQGAGNGIVSGTVQNGSGTVSLTKEGAGTWLLTGANTYTGVTTVNAGTLRLVPAPVAAYSFDSVSGSTVVNTGSGGTAMNGTLTGGATVVSGGKYGNAVSLSGGAYVNIGSPVVDLSNTASWAVSAWVKTTTAGSTLLSKGTGTSWSSGNTIFYLGDGTGGGLGGIPSSVRYAGGFFQGSASATAVNDGSWHMVTYVNQGGTYAIYVDGTAQALSSGNSGFSNADVGSVIRLGFTTDPVASDGTVHFNGLLDEVQLYNQALSAAQVKSLYNGQVPAGSLPSNAYVTVGSAGTLDVSGVNQTIATLNGTGTLTKTGPGTLTLTGSNAFTGTATLGGGALAVGGSLPAGGTLTTASGTVLTGSGTINAATTINGTHQPGASPGTQSFGALTYGGTARLTWELLGNSDTSSFDKVTASGAVTVTAGAALDVVLNGAGSVVTLTNAFWTQAHSWPVVTAGSFGGGTFALGTVSADPGGRAISNYGTLVLQQSGSALSLVFTPYTAQQNWLRQYFGTDWNNAAVAANAADPDGDGISNLVEWALGLDPTRSDAATWTAGAAGLPVETTVAVGGQNYLALQVRRPTGRTGIGYGAKVSGDLATWTDGVQEGTATANGDGTETVVFRDTVSVGQGDRRFIRLVVTQ